MLNKLNKRGGFTLVEIMIVVAIIALLASIAVPSLARSRKRSQASRTLEELRMIDSAVDQYAIEFNRSPGSTMTWTGVQTYLKSGTVLYTTSATVLGHTYGNLFTVDSIPRVPTATFNALSDVAPTTFWSPYN